jgi:serine/threonine-protein kinase
MDVYGLGITVWELLAGRHPYMSALGDDEKLVRLQRGVMPPLLAEVVPGLPPAVDTVLQRAVAKRPAMRYASVTEMQDALENLRAWLIEQERAGRLRLLVPPGQPPIPGDASPYDLPRARVQDPAATMEMDPGFVAAIEKQRKEGRR